LHLYDIRCPNGNIRVTVYTTREDENVWSVEKFFEESTNQLKRRRP
jgi:hypothetical protein